MKNIIAIIFFLGAAALFPACDGLDLEEGLDPINSVPSGSAISDFKSAVAAANGMYDQLQIDHDDSYLFLAQIYSDEADFTGTFPTRFEFDLLNVSTSNGTLAGAFTNFYDKINVANGVIDLLPKVEDAALTPEIISNFLGQARFIRAFCYSYLVEYHGDVPLVLTPTVEVGDVLNVPNVSKADIYAQIIDDLKFAEANITDTDMFKASSAAATALLARTYLYMGNYSSALSSAEMLVSSYDLVSAAYLEDAIFYLGFTEADGNFLNFWYGPSELGGRHDIEPSAKMLAAYEEGDLRRDLSVDDSFITAAVPYSIKYDDFSAGASGTGTDPVYLFRFAEQFLIAAEAAAEMGDFSKANGYYNTVRERAGLAEKTLDASNYVDLILQERFVELSLEGVHRWLDLRRRGRAADEIPNYLPCHDVWPIPQRDIDRNPNLTQNNCCNC